MEHAIVGVLMASLMSLLGLWCLLWLRTHPEERMSSDVMPPYRAVLVVDAVGFSELPSAQQSELGAAIVPVLEAAFCWAGLADAWTQRRFRPRAHTGDGY